MDIKKKRKAESVIVLLITTVFWGSAFVFQKDGMKYLGPFAFNFFRSIVALIFLFIVNIFWTKKKNSSKKNDYLGFRSKKLIIGGVTAGSALFLGLGFQQMGMVTADAAKAGFITAMYIVIVPIMGLFYGKRADMKTWLCVIIAGVGLYLISIKKGFHINIGDALIFVSAIFYALQIVLIDIFAPGADPIKLSIVQCITTGILSCIVMLFTENVSIAGVMGASTGIIYTGLLSLGVGFTVQIFAQKNLSATVSCLIMSMESVFAVVAGYIFLGEVLTEREIVGCVIMFIAIIMAQVEIPQKFRTGRGGAGGFMPVNEEDGVL